jgi:hypothetical protein
VVDRNVNDYPTMLSLSRREAALKLLKKPDCQMIIYKEK